MNELTQVYAEHHSRILGYVCNRVGDLTLAEDITSEIFLKIAEHLGEFDPAKSNLTTWVYTITNRTLTDYFRGRRVFVEIPEDNGENGPLPEELIDRSSLDEKLLLEDQLQLLASALKALPQRDRDLIVLHYFNGLTLKTVAEEMGMSYINAKVVHRKVLNKLKDLMK